MEWVAGVGDAGEELGELAALVRLAAEEELRDRALLAAREEREVLITDVPGASRTNRIFEYLRSFGDYVY